MPNVVEPREAALSALHRGDTNAACRSLGAAQNYVRAQTGKKPTQDQATTINNALQKIREKAGFRSRPPLPGTYAEKHASCVFGS